MRMQQEYQHPRRAHKWHRWIFRYFIVIGIALVIGGADYYISTIRRTEDGGQASLLVASSTSLVQPAGTLQAAATGTVSANYKFGISVGNTLPGLSDADLNVRLDDMASLSAGWLRFDISWDDIQATSSVSYQWAKPERIVNAAIARQMKLLPILTYTPKWARAADCLGGNKCPPVNPSDFANFAAEAVKHFKINVHAWEVWNEPNLAQFWQPAANVADYATLLKAAYPAMKAQDAAATVITGSLGPTDTAAGNIAQLEYFDQFYKQGTKSSFDAVGYHPYSFPVRPLYKQPWNAWTQMNDTKPSLRSIMAANGDSAKKIWITEFGAPTGGPGAVATLASYNLSQYPTHVDEQLQAQILIDGVGAVPKLLWAGPLFWYSYKDAGTDPSTIENFFGLLRFDGSRKPAYDAVISLLHPATTTAAVQ